MDFRHYDEQAGWGAPRAGLENLEQGDKWSFCLTAGTLCPANQERQ